MRIPRLALISVTAALAGLFAACGGADPTATPTATPKPADGDTTPAATPTPAFDATAYFKGKTIRMVVGFNPGGGTDTQARFLGAKWTQFIPGKPRIVVSNLTPSIAANNYVWAAEPDGFTLLYNATSIIGDSADPNAAWTPSEFQIIGAPVQRNAVWMIKGDMPYADITDAMGASGPAIIQAGSAATPGELTGVGDLGNMLLADWLDIPYEFNLVAATGTEQELLMIERGDTNSWTAGSVWYQLPQRRPGWVADGFVKPFTTLTGPGGVVLGNTEGPINISNARDLLAPEQQDIWDGIMTPDLFVGKNLMAPPGTQPEVVAALRDAWTTAVNDASFRADFERLLGQPIEITDTGAELQVLWAKVEDSWRRNAPQMSAIQERLHAKYLQ
jgi:tripartite-type tricarboxylate transporter receptor subunit TctC